MLYVDNDLINKWWGEEINNPTVGVYLRIAALKDVVDIYIYR